jgi:hypothetical protein
VTRIEICADHRTDGIAQAQQRGHVVGKIERVELEADLRHTMAQGKRTQGAP